MTTPDDPATPEPPYGQPSGSGGAEPGYGQPPPAFGPPAGYGTAPGFGPPAGYGAPPGYPGPEGNGAPAGYGAPASGGTPYASGFANPARNGLGVAALIVGILSIPLGLTVIVGSVMGIVAIVLGITGRSRVKRGEANNPGVALWGIITGIIGIVVSVAVIVLALVVMNTDSFKNLQDCLDKAHTATAKRACQTQFHNNLTGNN